MSARCPPSSKAASLINRSSTPRSYHNRRVPGSAQRGGALVIGPAPCYHWAMAPERLVRCFKDEAVGVYLIDPPFADPTLRRYVVSTRDTRDFMNHPEIINCDFTRLMENGVTNVLKGLNMVERLSTIGSKTVNVYHILRGGLNFGVREALRKAFGYKWHSSSYISSQRVLKEGRFEVSDDTYRKFLVPNNATVYFGDIVASGVSLDNGVHYLASFMERTGLSLRNLVFVTIGCVEAERVLAKWHREFKARWPGYDRTILIYLEGRFALAGEDTPLANRLKDTDLLKSYKLGALLSPEFEGSQFGRMIVGLEGCAIYDGGKKSFEPVNHIRDVLDFWEKQIHSAEERSMTLWDEYNARFPLDMYFADRESLTPGSPEILARAKAASWPGLEPEEFVKLHAQFRRLWSPDRVEAARRPGSLAQVCAKKISYLKSLVAEGD
jgi:hypothetical protein